VNGRSYLNEILGGLVHHWYNPRMNQRCGIRLVIVLLLLSLVASAKDAPIVLPAQTIPSGFGNFQLSDISVFKDGGKWHLSGTVTNQTDRAWRHLSFRLNLLDKNGRDISLTASLVDQLSVKDVAKGATAALADRVGGTPVEFNLWDGKPAAVKISFLPGESYYDSRYVFRLMKPVQSVGLTFEDDVLSAAFDINHLQLGFTLRNKSDEPIEIYWDKASYVDTNGNSHRVIHKGVKLADRDAPQATTMIPPSAKWDDFVVPSDSVEWLSIIHDWTNHPMLPPTQRAITVKGKTFSLFLPVSIGGKQKNLMFTFEIADVVI
jgi:hypothetical protein